MVDLSKQTSKKPLTPLHTRPVPRDFWLPGPPRKRCSGLWCVFPTDICITISLKWLLYSGCVTGVMSFVWEPS